MILLVHDISSHLLQNIKFPYAILRVDFFLSSDTFEVKTLFILVEHHPWNKMYKK